MMLGTHCVVFRKLSNGVELDVKESKCCGQHCEPSWNFPRFIDEGDPLPGRQEVNDRLIEESIEKVLGNYGGSLDENTHWNSTA